MDKFNIPKIIHYCWFGNKEKPSKVEKCIKSWEKHLSDYQIIEWNEQNFDVHKSLYVEQAYNEKKFAFVSDVARLKVLQQYGGIYMDTDVEVFKPFDDLLNNKCLLGFEEGNYVATSFMACIPFHPLIEEFILEYKNESFLSNGILNMKTNVQRFAFILQARGLVRNGEFQVLKDEIVVYPKDYFSPYDYINCIKDTTENSYCIHHFHVSWMPRQIRAKKLLKRLIVTVIGRKSMNNIREKLSAK
ncbi:glycosyltransferase family 32 protein [Paenisporosarcina antarctica]|nr:glycosyltransferase [Paenisporosarcina antarctica]